MRCFVIPSCDTRETIVSKHRFCQCWGFGYNLGSSSEVATAKENVNATDSRTKVICVYAYDWRDEIDARRIREELRSFGITHKILYKADQGTMKVKYAKGGDKGISTYYE